MSSDEVWTPDPTSLGGFAFIATLLDPAVVLPFDLIPKHRLRRATPTEIEQIRRLLLLNGAFSVFRQYRGNPYERDVVSEIQPDGSQKFHFAELIPDRWRYFVIAFEGSNSDAHDLELAGLICRNPIEIVATFVGWGEHLGPGLNPSAFFQFYDKQHSPMIPQMLGESEISEWLSIYQRWKIFEKPYAELARAFEIFRRLRDIQELSSFHTLGMFTVIEALVTHRPRSSETGDSLTHQVRTKLPLLAKRFTPLVEVQPYFPGVDPKTAWEVLYEYRSAIAHGRSADFTSKKLKPLQSETRAKEFLCDFVRALRRHTLIEPELISDLREC